MMAYTDSLELISLIHKNNSNLTIFNPSEPVDESSDYRIVLSFVEGRYIKPSLLSDELKNILELSLMVSPVKRATVLTLYNRINNIETDNYVILPLDKETQMSTELMSPDLIGTDYADILLNILDFKPLAFLQGNQFITYTPTIAKIPDYLAFTQKEPQLVTINFIGNKNIEIQLDSQKNIVLESLSFLSVSDNNSTSFESQSVKSGEKTETQRYEKDIKHYQLLKTKIRSYLLIPSKQEKEKLIAYIKKNGMRIFAPLRLYLYLILFDGDIIEDLTEFDLSSLVLLKERDDYNQILKDVSRCGEFDDLFTTEEGKGELKNIFYNILVNKPKFIYFQGMEGILCNVLLLCKGKRAAAYHIFHSMYLKLLSNFVDEKTRLFKPLDLQVNVMNRLVFFVDPSLARKLEEAEVINYNLMVRYMFSLFTRSFSGSFLYRIWDILILTEVSTVYLVILAILVVNKKYIMQLDKETLFLAVDALTEDIQEQEFIDYLMYLHSFVPTSLYPIYVTQLDEEMLNFLRSNEFYKDRWWEFVNFYTSEIFVSVINVEDFVKIFEDVKVLDIRDKIEFEKEKIVNSFNYSTGLKKSNKDILINMLKKSAKVVVIVGGEKSEYYSVSEELIENEVKFITILKGGFDIVKMEKPDIIA